MQSERIDARRLMARLDLLVLVQRSVLGEEHVHRARQVVVRSLQRKHSHGLVGSAADQLGVQLRVGLHNVAGHESLQPGTVSLGPFQTKSVGVKVLA